MRGVRREGESMNERVLAPCFCLSIVLLAFAPAVEASNESYTRSYVGPIVLGPAGVCSSSAVGAGCKFLGSGTRVSVNLQDIVWPGGVFFKVTWVSGGASDTVVCFASCVFSGPIFSSVTVSLVPWAGINPLCACAPVPAEGWISVAFSSA